MDKYREREREEKMNEETEKNMDEEDHILRFHE